ncbi:MAG: nicotinate-nucleotide adenylyltransferase [Thermoleophilaceae bacterium]|nr:nicotinate-nucleotide adenylyltransferase [Thermoleophilaceae bacterium]
MRVGIMGGVFNPPHIGHVACACEALDQLGLDVVRLVPARRAPHRAIEPDPGADVRAELCERAIEGLARLEVSRLELDREGLSYTVDTLRAMHEANPEDQHFLILGADQAKAFPTWREPREVAALAALVIAERPGSGRDAVELSLAAIGGGDATFLDMPTIGISSTLIRTRVGSSRLYRHLVPSGVADLIEERGLYSTMIPGPAA